MIGIAFTGSGKTLVFTLPIIMFSMEQVIILLKILLPFDGCILDLFSFSAPPRPLIGYEPV